MVERTVICRVSFFIDTEPPYILMQSFANYNMPRAKSAEQVTDISSWKMHFCNLDLVLIAAAKDVLRDQMQVLVLIHFCLLIKLHFCICVCACVCFTLLLLLYSFVLRE